MTKTIKPTSPADERSYSIRQFCIAENISPMTYFKLRTEGRGPKEMRIGTAVRISYRARIDWQRARENPTGAEAAAIATTRAQLRQRGRAAATRRHS